MLTNTVLRGAGPRRGAAAIAFVILSGHRSGPRWLMALADCDAAEMLGASMLGSGKARAVRAFVTGGSPRSEDADLYRHYADALYRQALLTRRDPAWAEHVVCDVIANEAALAAIPERSEDELPRVFRTGKLRLIHAASCPFRYSSKTSCGVRYPSVEWRRVLL